MSLLVYVLRKTRKLGIFTAGSCKTVKKCTNNGWCTFTDGLTQVFIERYWLYASKLKNYGCKNVVWASSGMLRIEKPITFNKTCMWAFHTNSLLHGYVFHVCVHRNTMYTWIKFSWTASLLTLVQWLCLHPTVTNNSCQVWLLIKTSTKTLIAVFEALTIIIYFFLR